LTTYGIYHQGISKSKRKFIVVLVFQLLFQFFLFAQHNYYGSFVPPPDRTPYHLILTINSEDGFYLKKDLALTDYMTYVQGEKVFGTPYLFFEWLKGTITTVDGRTYQYPIRYDAYDQLISFANGKDTLDVTDEIREFSLSIPVQDSVIVSRFINANQFKNEKSTFYYEVIFDCSKGELLKTLQKNISSITDGLLASRGKKYFSVEMKYFYYDKNEKKILKITNDKEKLFHLLKISGNDERLLHSESFDQSKEEDLIRFFKLYCNL
jgi:hypothetical protein